MYIHTLSSNLSQKSRKRIGRGGKRGTYSGKGQKGQKSRSGAKISPLFTGGSAALAGQGSRVIHKKRGQSPVQGHHKVTNVKNKTSYKILKISKIAEIFDNGSTINKESLIEAKLITSSNIKVKILGNTDQVIDKKFIFEGVALSKNVNNLYTK
jgi:large subunit ribosomal protein L15